MGFGIARSGGNQDLCFETVGADGGPADRGYSPDGGSRGIRRWLGSAGRSAGESRARESRSWYDGDDGCRHARHVCALPFHAHAAERPHASMFFWRRDRICEVLPFVGMSISCVKESGSESDFESGCDDSDDDGGGGGGTAAAEGYGCGYGSDCAIVRRHRRHQRNEGVGGMKTRVRVVCFQR